MSHGISSSQSPVRVFISYAHKDAHYLADFKKWLVQLERDGEIVCWDDESLVPGVLWDEEIRRKIRQADLVVFLVTQNLLGSEYIYQVEIQQAIQAAKEDRKTIVPVACEVSTLQDSQLARFQTLPDGPALTLWNTPQEGWLTVYKGIQKTVEKIRNNLDPLSLAVRLGSDSQVSRIPALFPGMPELPLASLYVELRLDAPRIRTVSRQLLAEPQTLAQVEIASEALQASPGQTLDDAIHSASARRFVILGDPGCGKSSLLKRITHLVNSREWRRWTCAFYVPLRIIVRRKPATEPWNGRLLLQLAMEACQVSSSTAQLLATNLMNQEVGFGQPIFLFDGLDELLSNQESHADISDLLSRLPGSIDWIVTSRFTGISHSLAEDRRYQISSLDDKGVEALVVNWFHHSPSDSGQQTPTHAAEQFLKALFANPRLTTMARSPFLLSALCYLETQQPKFARVVLPTTRVEVYEQLFAQISRSAQQINSDNSILDRPSKKRLEEFCYWLYTQPGQSVIQIFDIDHWERFQQEQFDEDSSAGGQVDLSRRILPGRLLTQLSSEYESFHFLHLTLQEFLIAKALLDKPIEEAIEKRFNLAFRNVLPFFATLLIKKNRHQDFKRFFSALADPPDLCCRMLIDASTILYDTAIDDVKPFLNFDLVERLWDTWESEDRYLSSAALLALCRLPPELTQVKLSEKITETENKLKKLPHEDPELAKEAADSWLDPFLILSGRRDGVSEMQLIDRFISTDDERLAFFLTRSLASTLTRTGRRKIQIAAQTCWHDKKKRRRFVALLALCSGSQWTQFLGDSLANLIPGDSDYPKIAMYLSWANTHDAAILLRRELVRCQQLVAEDRNILVVLSGLLLDLINMTVPQCNQYALEVVSMLSSKDAALPSLIEIVKKIQEPEHDALLFELANSTTDDELWDFLHRLTNFCEYGWIPSDEIVMAGYNKLVECGAEQSWDMLYLLDIERMENGKQPLLVEHALSWLNLTVSRSYPVVDHRDEAKDYFHMDSGLHKVIEADDPRESFEVVCAYLSAAGKATAVAPLLVVAESSRDVWSSSDRYSALGTIAKIIKNKTSDEILADIDVSFRLNTVFEAAVKCDEHIVAGEAAWALGHWDISALFALRSQPLAKVALCRFSSTVGHLFYENFYVTPQGVVVGSQL